MLAKDSVTTRLDRGLSFTEFSYMLIQATDFEHLHRTMGVELQMGGADQWGNITAGLELIRRRAGGGEPDGAPGVENEGDPGGEADAGGGHAHGLAYKLLLSPSGTKFGKTAGGEFDLARRRANLAVRLLPVLAERRRPGRRDVPALVHAPVASHDRRARARTSSPGPRPAARSGRWPGT